MPRAARLRGRPARRRGCRRRPAGLAAAGADGARRAGRTLARLDAASVEAAPEARRVRSRGPRHRSLALVAPGIAMMNLLPRDATDSRLDLIRVAPGTALLTHGHTAAGDDLRPVRCLRRRHRRLRDRRLRGGRRRARPHAARAGGRGLRLPDRDHAICARMAGSAGWCARCSGCSAVPSASTSLVLARAWLAVDLLNGLAPRAA